MNRLQETVLLILWAFFRPLFSMILSGMVWVFLDIVLGVFHDQNYEEQLPHMLLVGIPVFIISFMLYPKIIRMP